MTPRPNLPETSHLANAAADFKASHRALIYAELCEAYPKGLTAEEISLRIEKLDAVQVNRCMAELERDKLAQRRIVAWNEKLQPIYEKRRNVKDRQMAVWYRLGAGQC